MHQFNLDRGWFHGKRTNIKRPMEIAHFSYDENHQLHPFSDLSLRYYFPPFTPAHHVPPPPAIDLKTGFSQFRKQDETGDDHLDSLLGTIELLERRDGKKLDASFITWRGMMTKFVTSLFDHEDEFEMLATLYQDTMQVEFIEEDHEAKLRRDARQSAQFRRPQNGLGPDMMQYWGYKFEALALLNRPHTEVTRDEIENRTSAIVENSSQYCSIVRTGLGPNAIVVGGEVDGVIGYKPDNPMDPPRWIELKTARKPQSPKDFDIHSKKLLKFWAQSYLIGCPNIVIGYRDRDGMLYELENLETQKIPTMVQRMYQFKWDANACLSAASALLEFLKANITESGVWRISRAKGEPAIRLSKDESFGSGTGNIISSSFKSWRESAECV
ncbi:RAI1-domain-containing protein [Myriangium duriaei CBS 260.36]|uniref:Decapping nuclease n=1 Tax=Myriangium duriaei CBS 260.36 TaxID=1168546 RepID=A0A9P4MM36_9PEZI|nr:RAI1-domain-containing protein [Myriangium duriaei CBS 260.36]